MNSRERELSVIRHEVPDQLPVDVMEFENSQPIQQYAQGENNESEEDIFHVLGIDGRRIQAAYTKQMPEGFNVIEYTEWMTPRAKHYGTNRYYPLAWLEAISDLSQVTWPDVEGYDYTTLAQEVRRIGKKYAVRAPKWQPLFCRVIDMVGMEKTLTIMLLRPILFEAILERITLHVYDLCRHHIDTCGENMPILYLGDDFATQRGMMLSPKLWRKYLRPRYAKLFELGKNHGKYVWFHSCGDITDVLPDLIDIGLDVWETVQLHALPITPKKLKNEYGRHITFFGGISTQLLPFFSVEQVRDHVVEIVDCLGRGGGYICGPDHSINTDVPPENVLALFSAAKKISKHGYTQ